MASIPPPVAVGERLKALHDEIRAELDGVARVALTVYDRKTDSLSTYAHSNVDGPALVRYEAKLADVPSLRELAETRRDRVVADTAVFRGSKAIHSQVVATQWGSSYTRPLFDGDRLRGFIFFDAVCTNYFTPAVVLRLGVYAELMALLLASSLFPVTLLHSALEIASDLAHERDPETGAHLDRMSRYARLIALGIAEKHSLNDAFLENILQYAPLHDIGKIAIPDRILLKPGRLTDDEMAIMRTHVTHGIKMIDRLLGRLGSPDGYEGEMLRNIVLHHHEAWNGGGYPNRLTGDSIPLVARIVTVADVYDALTSDRPYKQAWEPASAMQYLTEHSGRLFDPDCVAALINGSGRVAEIASAFPDPPGAVRLHEGYDNTFVG